METFVNIFCWSVLALMIYSIPFLLIMALVLLATFLEEFAWGRAVLEGLAYIFEMIENEYKRTTSEFNRLRQIARSTPPPIWPHWRP